MNFKKILYTFFCIFSFYTIMYREQRKLLELETKYLAKEMSVKDLSSLMNDQGKENENP